MDEGVPASALLFDPTAINSWDEAVNTLRLMQTHNFHRVLVVSDPPHMRRLSWAWGKVFAGSGNAFVLIASGVGPFPWTVYRLGHKQLPTGRVPGASNATERAALWVTARSCCIE